MRTAPLVLASLAAATLLTTGAQPAAAQSRLPTPTNTMFDVTPYAGVMLFGPIISGPFNTSITNAPATVVGAQLGMKIAPNISLIGNLATASSDVQAGLPYIGGFSVAKSSLLMYDAGLQLDLPYSAIGGTAFSPFLQIGGGAMRYDLTEAFVTRTTTNLAGNVGAGADISVGSGVGLRFMARDYLGSFNLQDATSLNVPTNTTQNFAFTAGLRFSF